jgi:hypothetical protein
MPTGLVRLNLAGALHEDAGDDLEAVRDPVLHLLQKDGLLAQQVVLKLRAGSQIERRQKNITITVLAKIAAALGKKPEELVVAPRKAGRRPARRSLS